ncbi:MAG TPA: phage tail tube protein [Intrasporangium sp.]|jgi:hypothetical protein|uniref:phage tail tube protein n=1 Tax=Intrasporangium sp. TaxID=1925024 RepID=UPI002F9420CB
MAIGSGLSGQFGVAKETTYGTYVAPTKFYEMESGGVNLDLIRVEGGGIAAGRAARLVSQSVIAGRGGTGTFVGSVPIVGFGLLLQQLFGTAVTPVQQGATAAYLQTHALAADLAGKSLTAQFGVPSTNGTVNPYTGLGGKITKAGFSCAKDDMLKASIEFDFRDISEANPLAAATYNTNSAPFNFMQLTVKAGTTVAGATAVSGVTGISLDVERNQKTDRRYADGTGLKAEPITNDFVGASGSIDADFVAKADLADRFAANTTTALVFEFLGATIELTNKFALTFEMPAVKLTGATPQVGGPDVVSGGFPFTVYSNGTDPIVTAKYVTTDVTL